MPDMAGRYPEIHEDDAAIHQETGFTARWDSGILTGQRNTEILPKRIHSL